MGTNNGKFKLCIEVLISSEHHEACLHVANKVKKLCEAWSFEVKYDEHKSARKGPVLKRDILIYQTSYAQNIITFKESIRIICSHYNIQYCKVDYHDRSITPLNIEIN